MYPPVNRHHSPANIHHGSTDAEAESSIGAYNVKEWVVDEMSATLHHPASYLVSFVTCFSLSCAFEDEGALAQSPSQKSAALKSIEARILAVK